MRFRSIGTVAAAAFLLAACDFSKTGGATFVGDTSARLEGTIDLDAAETVTWWFEYGTSPDFDEETPQRGHTSTTAGSADVAAIATGLIEDTTYHYRLCIYNDKQHQRCGDTQTFTTTSGRDSVLGVGLADWFFDRYYNGATVDASSEPDGSSPTGHASAFSPGQEPTSPDEGPVTCLRVEGGRAAVGFTADRSAHDPELPPVHFVLHIEDNGTRDDRFVAEVVAAPTTTCPAPDATLLGEQGREVTGGDGFVVHDHP